MSDNKPISMKDAQAEQAASDAQAAADAAPPQFKFKSQVMFLDKRPIEAIRELYTIDGAAYALDVRGVTLIEIYGENGPICMLPWLAVWRGEQIILRAPAQAFSVKYVEAN